MCVDWARNVPVTSWTHQRHVKQVASGPSNPGRMHDAEKHTLLGQRISVHSEDMTIYTTRLSESTRPFPGRHPLHGTEIVPAAVLINTFYHGAEKRDLRDIVLRTPVALSALRDVQVTKTHGQVRVTSRLALDAEEEGNEVDESQSWVTHTTGRYGDE